MKLKKYFIIYWINEIKICYLYMLNKYILIFIIIIIIFVIFYPVIKEHMTDVLYYSGKKINGAKTVMYFTPIPIVLSPKHGNQTRILSTLKYFIQKRYNIIIICNESYGWTPEVIKYLKENYVSIYIIKDQSYINIYNKEKPDIIFINYIDMLSQNVINKMKKIILDLHDCPVSNSEMYKLIRKGNISENSNFELIKNKINSIKENKLDLSNYKIDYLIHISYEEYEKYKKYEHIKHIYIPYYEDNKQYDKLYNIFDKFFNKNREVIFVASDNDFNLFAFKYFYKNTLPKIVEQIPNFKLYVYGIICDKLKKYGSPNIVYMGFVPNKNDIYEKAKFVICPLLFGTGAKIKVLEAISFNIPIVSYEFSGTIELKHNINGLIAKDNEEFAKYIIELYNNKELLNKLSKSDYKLNYNILDDEMNKIISEIML